MDQTQEASWEKIYRQRRNTLREALGHSAILWMGHTLQPRNYPNNHYYPFRQNSNFLYYCGLSEPDLALLMFPESDHDILFAKPQTIDDIIWTGGDASPMDLAASVGVEKAEDPAQLGLYLARTIDQGLELHYLAPYQLSSLIRIANLLALSLGETQSRASQRLKVEVAKQRSIKSVIEIAEIEDALSVTNQMHRAAMAAARPGIREYEIAGIIEGTALARNRRQAFQPIVTVHGETLHNQPRATSLEAGQLLLNDAGAESPMFYASDITRTIPVSGRFNPVQAEVYQIVHRMQLSAIAMMKPGIPYREVHLAASKILAEGLRAMGLMKGNPSDAAAAGAHALFFPHGVGHAMGLDVHDMEDLGEDIVGYARGEDRSKQFGLNSLRFGRSLEAGFVLTVEPGIYFIPTLIERWEAERKHSEFISYDKLEPFRTFGGIRIEDDVLIIPDGARVLGPGIPKTIPEIEREMGAR
jgi:Xaa-Pro aminopeptidase